MTAGGGRARRRVAAGALVVAVAAGIGWLVTSPQHRPAERVSPPPATPT